MSASNIGNMNTPENLGGVCLRYCLDNNAPVDLLEFTKSLQALQSEYSTFIEKRGYAPIKAHLNIQKVQEGSILIELIEAVLPTAVSLAGGVNTLAEFGGYIGRVITALKMGEAVPSESYNKKSLDNVSTFIQPLASNPQSTMKMEISGVVNGNVYNNCTFDLDSLGANAAQNRANIAKATIEEEVTKTEEVKTRVLLRLARLDRETESKHDRGIIEFFDNKSHKLLIDDEVKSWFMSSDENVFKNLYYVDATALYYEGKIKAYRITKVYESFLMDD